MSHPMSHRVRAVLATSLASSVLLATTVLAAHVEPRKLHDPFIWGSSISQDSSRIVYSVGTALYSQSPSGAPAVILNQPLPSDYVIGASSISPDSSRVVYTARQMGEQTKPSMFASVPLNGGASAKLYDPASATEKIDWSLVSPNSARVVFTVAKSNDSNSPRNLYSVPLDGSTPPTKVNADLGTGERVDSAYITPDSSKIVYVVSKAEPGTAATTTLYSAPLAGGTSTTLATNPTNLQLTSDSLRVVYAYKAQPTDQYQLYSVSIASAQPTRLDIPVNAEVSQYFKLSRDNQRVVFRTGEASAKSNLYSTMIDGSGTAIKINGAPSTDDRVKGFDISPDSSRVVYIADSGPFSADELYSVAITGGAVVKLNQAFDPAKGGYVEYPFQISPDSKYVVYKTRISDALHSVPINGSAPPIKISGPLIPSGFISAHEIQITSDSQTVLYRGEGTSNSNYDLFSTSINGSRPAHKLNGSVPIVAGYPYQFDFGNSVLISPNNQFVTFHGAQGEYSGRSLYVASVDPNVPLPLPTRGQHKMFLPSVARN